MAAFKQGGTEVSASEVLKMSASTSDSWCTQSLSACPRMLSGAYSFVGVDSLEGPPYVSCGHTEGRVARWWCESGAGDGGIVHCASLVL